MQLSIIPCFFQNVLAHKSDGGCAIGKGEDGSTYHIYYRTTVSRDADNNTVVDWLRDVLYDDEEPPIIVPYLDDCNKCRVVQKISPPLSILTMGKIISSREETSVFICSHVRNYLQSMLPRLNNIVASERILQESRIHLTMNSLFDVYVDQGNGYKVMFLRPLAVTLDTRNFYTSLRDVIFDIVRKYSVSDECIDLYKTQKRLVRDKISCSCVTFSGRRVPPELKCAALNASSCPHIPVYTTKEGKLLLQRVDARVVESISLQTVKVDGQPLDYCCNFLLEALLDEGYSDTQVNTAFNFKCQFLKSDLWDSDSRINSALDNIVSRRMYSFISLFGRHSMIHRFCVPRQFLTENWLNWVIEIICRGGV